MVKVCSAVPEIEFLFMVYGFTSRKFGESVKPGG